MKKIIFPFTIILMLISTQMYAQGVRYGFKAGINYSEISGYEFDLFNQAGEEPREAFGTSEEGRYGFTAAFFAEIPLSDNLSFQPEFAFSTQGNKFEGLRYDHLQLPLGVRLNINRLFIIAGPQAGIKISFYEQSENYTSLDFLAFGGIGYHFNESVFIEARFTKGFMEVFEDDSAVRQPFIEQDTNGPDNGNRANGDNFLINNTGTNQYFTLSLGYRL